MKHVVFCAFIFVLVIVILFSIMPNCTIEAYREHSFVVNKKFQDVQIALGKEDVLEKVLAANDGIIIDKKLIDREFNLHRPFSKDRSWDLYSVTLTKILVHDLQAGALVLDLRQTLNVNQELIKAEVRLDRPIDIGLTDMNQLIEIKSYGEGKTIFRIKLYMRLSRKIPAFIQPRVNQRLQKAADKRIIQFEPIFREQLANSKPGLLFP